MGPTLEHEGESWHWTIVTDSGCFPYTVRINPTGYYKHMRTERAVWRTQQEVMNVLLVWRQLPHLTKRYTWATSAEHADQAELLHRALTEAEHDQ